jgi:hypothetical protein
MQGQGMVIRRLVHDKQCMRWNGGESWLGEPCRAEVMMHVAVLGPGFPRALQGQCCPRYPAALCHRMHKDKPRTLPCRLLYPRTIFICVPDKIIPLVLVHLRFIQIDFGTKHRVPLAIRPLFAEIPLTRRHHMIFCLEGLCAGALATSTAPPSKRPSQCPHAEIGLTPFLLQRRSSHLERPVRAFLIGLANLVSWNSLQGIREHPGRAASVHGL